MTLHRRSLKTTLTFLLLSLASLTAAGQNSDARNRFPSTPPCAVRTPYGQGCDPSNAITNQMSRPRTPASTSPTPSPFYGAGTYDQASDTIVPYPVYRPAPAVTYPAAPDLEVKELEPKEQDQKTVPRANPDAPDQSELLKNSKDPDYILRNFKTMYIELRDIDLFGPAQI